METIIRLLIDSTNLIDKSKFYVRHIKNPEVYSYYIVKGILVEDPKESAEYILVDLKTMDIDTMYDLLVKNDNIMIFDTEEEAKLFIECQE